VPLLANKALADKILRRETEREKKKKEGGGFGDYNPS
jgi:hypothetical protein